MKVTLEIQRFYPGKDEKPFFQKFLIEAEPTERLLSVLMKVKRTMDPSLGFRKSCAHGVCGSDAMVVNGKERLACKTLIKDIVSEKDGLIKIMPLQTLPIQRALMVDQSLFFSKYQQISPFFISKSKPKKTETIQTPEERKRYDEGTKCILCAACFSACPVIQETNPRFLGPAAIVQAARFIDDSRDEGFEERRPQLDYPDGIWPCESRFQCTRVCPRGIKVTKIINLTKNKIKNRKS